MSSRLVWDTEQADLKKRLSKCIYVYMYIVLILGLSVMMMGSCVNRLVQCCKLFDDYGRSIELDRLIG
jgi:hypothetical protein